MSGMYISGLASGIDTDSLVTRLMQLESRAVNRIDSQKQQLQLKASAWGDIRTRLVNLQQAARDLCRSSLYRQKVAFSGDEGLVSVTAGPNAATGSYQLEILTLARAHSVTGFTAADITDNKDSGAKTPLGLSGTLIINGTCLEIDEGDSLQGTCQKINASSEIGVKAAVIDRRLMLTRVQTGLSEIGIENSELSRALGLLMEQEPGVYVPQTIQPPSEARFKLNGLEITRSANLIDDVLEGVTFNLLQETGAPVTITVQDDYSEITAKVQSFVQQYNSTYQFIKSKLSVDPAAGVKGTLYGEGSLHQVLSSIRRTVTGSVEGAEEKYNCLAAIGINTARWNSGEPEGTLVLDQDRLTAALKEAPEAVAALLSGDQGAAGRLEGYITGLTRYGEGLIDTRSKGLQTRIRELNRRADNLHRLLEKREQTLRNQFLAAERMMGQMAGQGQWLDQQLASIPNFQAHTYRR